LWRVLISALIEWLYALKCGPEVLRTTFIVHISIKKSGAEFLRAAGADDAVATGLQFQ
jgi:hypothetical protein